MVSTPSIDQMQATQYQNDTNLQNFFNKNATDATNQYNQSRDQANQAQSQLSDFTKNMQSGTDIYAKQLQSANQNAGYDVNNLNQAQNQVSQLTGILGGLPRALQASNANYGATAGNVANQYATTGANLNQSLQLANQNAQNQLAKQQAGLTGAQAATTAGVQTQDQQRQAYTAAANNAAQIMNTAQTQMAAMIQAQQNGQRLTAENQAVFGQLRQAYANAAAAYAQANLLAKQAAFQDAQTQDYLSAKPLTTAAKQSQASQITTPQKNASGGGFNLVDTANSIFNPITNVVGKTAQQAGRNVGNFFGDVGHNLGWY